MQQERPQDPLSYEQGFWGRGLSRIAGVVLIPGTCIEGATDSKRLRRERREELAREILARAEAVTLGAASVREIDRLNIGRATRLAMRRALDALPERPEHVVIDGLPVKGLGWKHEALVGGDGLVHSISCASIVAKVVRDDLMRRLARRYPAFGWESNAGYGSRAHLDAVAEIGPTPHHRLSFLGVQFDLGL